MSNAQKILTGIGAITSGLIAPVALNGDATVSLVLISLGLICLSEIKIPRKHRKEKS
nr:MAG TPA: hypothetical protein [Caudoviricetes sp.]